MHPEFWRGKKVLITGHTGFKGSWLSLWLQQLGANLKGYALAPSTKPSLFEEARVAEGMDSTLGDVRDYALLRQTIDIFRPEIVIHMAAQPLVRRSYVDPIETYSTNVMGTAHLFEAIRACDSTRVVVNVTTDKVYENKEWIWPYREDDRLGGHDPYSSSKACSELVTSAYRASFLKSCGVAVATARAGNVIGGGDWSIDRLVPDVLRAFELKKPVEIRNPHATRPWQHVLEPLSGYLTLAEHLWSEPNDFESAWNFGPEQADVRPVGWVVQRLCELWGAESRWTSSVADHPHEAMNLSLDISKAQRKIKWRPRWSLDFSLKMVVDWQRQFLSSRKPNEICRSQFDQFLS